MCLDIQYPKDADLTQYYHNLVIDQFVEEVYKEASYRLAMDYKLYPVIVNRDGQPHLRAFEWGVIANYMDSPEKIKAMRPSMCNARSEKILEDPKSFWNRIRNQRCLIPVAGIYEHQRVEGIKNKVPYFIQEKNRPVFFLPGLHYNKTFTVLTRPANEFMKTIHNDGPNKWRMPLFLTKELEEYWLVPDLKDDEINRVLQFELPSDQLKAKTVFTIRGKNAKVDELKSEAYAWPGVGPEMN